MQLRTNFNLFIFWKLFIFLVYNILILHGTIKIHLKVFEKHYRDPHAYEMQTTCFLRGLKDNLGQKAYLLNAHIIVIGTNDTSIYTLNEWSVFKKKIISEFH